MSEFVVIMLVVGGALVLIGARFWPASAAELPSEGWSPAKQIATDYVVERDHRRAAICIGVGLAVLWCDVVVALTSHSTFEFPSYVNPFTRIWGASSPTFSSCKSSCGDGICGAPEQSGICVGGECPCEEDALSCATDCAQTSIPIRGCEPRCGDGNCSLLTCIRPGCACAESFKSCPADCPSPPTEDLPAEPLDR